MLMRRRRRRAEGGQALVLAIAFIAFFGVVTAAVLNYASATGLQHVRTEATARTDSLAEGGAAWAAADAAASHGCSNTGTGTLTMQDGKVVSYQVIAPCNPGKTGVQPGNSCEICLMTTLLRCSNATYGADLQISDESTINITGEIDSNGSIYTESQSTLAAGKIQLVSGTTVCESRGNDKFTKGSCFCTPTPTYPYTTAIANPLAGLPAPTPSGAPQSVTDGSQTPLCPGLYSKIDLTGDATNVVLDGAGTEPCGASDGVYILTGPLSLKDSAEVASRGPVVIYLACPQSSPPYVTACTPGQSGGSISIADNAGITISGGSGEYDNVAVFSDPQLSDPSNSHVITVAGRGTLTAAGQVDVPSGTVATTDGGSLSIGTRLVAGYLLDAGRTTTSFTGAIPSPSCTVIAANVFDGTPGPGRTPDGSVVVKSDCKGQNGIVAFNYLP